jgi:hypothetical protein
MTGPTGLWQWSIYGGQGKGCGCCLRGVHADNPCRSGKCLSCGLIVWLRAISTGYHVGCAVGCALRPLEARTLGSLGAVQNVVFLFGLEGAYGNAPSFLPIFPGTLSLFPFHPLTTINSRQSSLSPSRSTLGIVAKAS